MDSEMQGTTVCYMHDNSGEELVQIFRRIHAYLSFHIYLPDILHFCFLMHVKMSK